MEYIESWATLQNMKAPKPTLSDKLIEAAGGRWYYPVLSLFMGAGLGVMVIVAVLGV
jgi:hypothetical protein